MDSFNGSLFLQEATKTASERRDKESYFVDLIKQKNGGKCMVI